MAAGLLVVDFRDYFNHGFNDRGFSIGNSTFGSESSVSKGKSAIITVTGLSGPSGRRGFSRKTLCFNHGFNDRSPFAHALLGRSPFAHGLRPKRAWFGECALLGRNPVAHGLRPKRAWFGECALLGRSPFAHGLRPKRAWFGECALLGRSPFAHGLRPKRAWCGAQFGRRGTHPRLGPTSKA